MARCVLGNYVGFILGCAETVEYIFYVANSTVALGGMVVMMEPSMAGLEPVIYIIFFMLSLLIHIFSGRLFWKFNAFLALVSLIIVLLYCLSSLKDVDFIKYAYTPSTDDAPVSNPWFIGGAYQFMQILPLSAWMFVGVETLRETCGDIPNPRINVPRGQVACMLTLLATGFFVLFVCASLPPALPATAALQTPFNNGTLLSYSSCTHML